MQLLPRNTGQSGMLPRISTERYFLPVGTCALSASQLACNGLSCEMRVCVRVPYFYGLTRAHSAPVYYVRIPPPPIVLSFSGVFGKLGFSLCVFVVPSRVMCARDTTVLASSHPSVEFWISPYRYSSRMIIFTSDSSRQVSAEMSRSWSGPCSCNAAITCCISVASSGCSALILYSFPRLSAPLGRAWSESPGTGLNGAPGLEPVGGAGLG